MISGSSLMRRTAALALSSRTCLESLMDSGSTWNTEPSVTSVALIGVCSGSRTRRSPFFHGVLDSASPGSGPMLPATWRTMGRAKRPSAPPRLYLISGRRSSCASVPPLSIVLTKPRRASSPERSGWRSSTTSVSGMRVLAPWMAPMPMPSMPRARETPRTMLDTLALPMPGRKTCASIGIAKYATRKTRVPSMEIPKKAASSSRSAARGMCGGMPGFSNRTGRWPVPSMWPWSSRTAVLPKPAEPWSASSSPCSVPCSFIVWSILSVRSGRVRWTSGGFLPEPDGKADHDPETEDPDEEPLGHGSHVTERHSTGVRLLVDAVQVGDDVVLALGADVGVVEDRHGLRAGHHRLVDVLALDVAQRRGVLPTGQRAAGAGEVVAHGAVDAEQLTAPGDVGVRARGRRPVRDGGSRGQGGHVGGHRSDLLVGELDVLLAGRLHAGHRQRHTAGAHLEVDRRRSDAGEAGAAGGALGAETVTGGAVGLEELLALLDLVGADGGGRGRLRCQGGI